MNTETLIKAAIIESRAVEARQLAASPCMTGTGRAGLYHEADGLIWAVSVLTAEPVTAVRSRVMERARDLKPMDQYRPRMVS